MLTQRNVLVAGFVILAAMTLLLLLVLFKLVPESWFVLIFLIAVVLFLIRITLRMVLARQRRLEESQRESERQGEPKT